MPDEDRQSDLNINAEVRSSDTDESLLAWSTAMRRKVAKRYPKKKNLAKALRNAIEDKIVGDIQLQLSIERDHREEQRQDELFYNGNETEWDELSKAQPQMRDLRVPMIAPIVDSVVGRCSKRPVQGMVTPVMKSAIGGNPEQDRMLDHVARVYDLRLKLAQDQIDYEMAKLEAIKSACVVGVGYIYHGIKPTRNGRLAHFATSPDWKNVYTDTSVKHMKDAKYAYILNKRKLENIQAMYPQLHKEIARYAQSQTEFVGVDAATHTYDTEAYQPAVRRGPYVGNYSPYLSSPPMQLARTVNLGHGYFYDVFRNDDGKLVSTCLFVNFLIDESFQDVLLLTAPEHLWGHNQIPLQRLTFNLKGKNNLPYSPLTYNMRGLQRSSNGALRNMNRMVGSRGAVVGMNSLPSSLDRHEHLYEIERRLSRAIYILPNFSDDPNAIKIDHHTQDIKNLSDSLGAYMQIAAQTSATKPAGDQAGQQESGDGIERAYELADLQFLEFHKNIDYQVVKPLFQQLLSEIEQFSRVLDTGLVREKGKFIEAVHDGDYSIEGNSAIFQIVPTERAEMITEEERQMIVAMMQKSPPEIGLPLLPLFLKTLPHGSTELLDDVKQILIKGGLNVPSSILTEEEKQMVAQLEQQRAQIEQMKMQLEVMQVQAEVKLKEAQAQAQIINATKPSEEKKALQDQLTIRRLEEELAAVRGQRA